MFAWRLKSASLGHESTPVLFLRDPATPLPPSTEYRNTSFYMFRPRPIASPSPLDGVSLRSGKSHKKAAKAEENDGVPNFKKEFERFHGENGVRTIIGSIGPVNNGGCRSCALALLFPLRVLTRTVPCRSRTLWGLCLPCACAVRMLLKSGYRHVYISRKFAIQNGFIPRDAAPGHYGYTGLVKYGCCQHAVAALLLTTSFYLTALGSGRLLSAVRGQHIPCTCPKRRTSTLC